MNRCYNCKFFVTQDTGYSNYTVEGTDIACMKKHFDWIEESYSWRGKKPEEDSDLFKRAESCEDFKQSCGVQINLDVDGEISIEDFKEDSEVYKIAKIFFDN